MNQKHEKSWVYHLIRHRTFSLVIGSALILAISFAAVVGIPVEVMPRENIPPFLFLTVIANEPMTPEKLESTLTLPLEGAVRTVPSLLKFTSNTSKQSVFMALTFKPRTDIHLAEVNLQEALQDLETKNILNMKKVSISKINPDATAVVKLSVINETEDNKIISEDLKIGLESIPEISKAEITGLTPPVYEYKISLAKAKEAGLMGQGLMRFFELAPLRESLGEAFIGNRFSAVNARMILEELAQLKEETVAQGSTTTLRNIASENIYEKSKEEVSHVNGSSAVLVEVFSKDGANLFELNNHLQEYLKTVRNLKFETIFNKTEDLKKAVDNVFHSLYEAILITFAVVYLFLRRWRPTALIALSIPSTLMITVLILYVKNVSLNVLTLSGLILGIGMVVDSAVLVVGRVNELRVQGFSRRESSAKGAADVFTALLLSTLTNAAIFLPVTFLEAGDSFTDILKAFQLPILASLGASLLVALFILPIAMLLWRDRKRITDPHRKPMSPALIRLVNVFRKIQKRRLLAGASTIALVFLTFNFIKDIEQTDLETPKDPYATINVTFTSETKPHLRKHIFEDFEKEIVGQKPALNYKFLLTDFNPQYLSGSVILYPSDTGDTDEALANLEKKVREFIGKLPGQPGVNISLGWESFGGTNQSHFSTFKFTGPKTSKLQEIVGELKEKVAKVKNVQIAKLDKEENGERSLVFMPNEAVLAKYKLDLAKVSKDISNVMSTAQLSNLKLNGAPVGVKIALFPAGDKWNLESLRESQITIAPGRFVTLNSLGEIIPFMSTRSINRNLGLSTVRLYVYFQQQVSYSDQSKAQSEIKKIISEHNFPIGYGTPQSDSIFNIEQMAEKSQFIIYLASLLIYLLLASMFESVLIPFAILFTVPLALLFGVAGLKIIGLPLDVMARLSLIILVGIGVNSAIILIDIIGGLREEGIRREDAVAIGCARRFRAVVMAASIQILSVLPIALGKAKIMGITYSSLGVAIISGMFFSTIITLIVLPMIYEFLDDLEIKIKSLVGLGSVVTIESQAEENHRAA